MSVKLADRPIEQVREEVIDQLIYNFIPKPPQYAEFSVAQELNIKALLCNNGNPF